MSKLVDMEPRHEQRKLELAQRAEERTEIDTEAALHMELLAETDAKLDRINARLDRFVHEITRLSQEQRREPAADPPPLSGREGSPIESVVMLLLLGAVGWAGYMLWQDDGASPVTIPEGALHRWLVGEPVSSLIEGAPVPVPAAPETQVPPALSVGDLAPREDAPQVADVPEGPQVEILEPPAPPARPVEQSAAAPSSPETPAPPPMTAQPVEAAHADRPAPAQEPEDASEASSATIQPVHGRIRL